MKLFVSYRQNSLFDQHLPRLLEGLTVVGTFTIPAGAELKDNATEYVAALSKAEELGATHFLSDNTCGPHHFKQLASRELPGFEKVWKVDIDLNGLFSRQIDKLVGTQTIGQNLVWFADQVANGGVVKTVIVVEDCIHDHGFRGTEEKTGPSFAGWVAEKIATHFNATAEVVPTLAVARVRAGDPSTMIVADRHCGIKGVMAEDNGWYRSLANWPDKSTLFTLPFETCLAQLMNRGLFPYSFDIAGMRSEVEEMAEKMTKS